MANETMVLLEKIVVPSAGASSITFTSIPQSYTDLQIRSTMRSTRSGSFDTITIKFNGNVTNMSLLALQGRGDTAVSFTGSSASYLGSSNGSTSTASTFSNVDVYIPNYTSSANKSYSVDSVAENNATGTFSAYQDLVAGLWSNSAAITSIAISPDNGSFVQYSTFYLYGIAKQGVTPTNAPAATGGDSIVFDGTYWIHTFTSSGTFTPKKALSCDYLVVAGGGGGASQHSGGGGGGGLRSTVGSTGGGGSLESALSLTAQAYTVTIGAGGAGGTPSGSGSNGNNSVFSTITSTAGGGGGVYGNPNGTAGSGGGSGGGGGAAAGGSGGAGGTGTANQGFAGGAGVSAVSGSYKGGGGGGAGAVGQTPTAGANTSAGNGGAGVSTSISGSSVGYAGGGGAGLNGGSGSAGTASNGGGAGAKDSGNGTAGTANTGGGGGSAGSNADSGGAGGSGIVIVRYAA